MLTCKRCGSQGDAPKKPILSFLTADLDSINAPYYCDACRDIVNKQQANEEREAAASKQKEWLARQELAQRAAGVVMTTTQHIEGHYVRNYLGIESVEYVIGTGVFSEVSSGVADFFGQRSTQFEGKLQQAKKTAMDALKMLAAEKGANAVIGVDIDYTEFSGNRVALIVNGTLVRVAPLKSREKGTRG